MFKNSLFIKIYLWFWMATIFVFLSVMMIEKMTDTGPRFFPNRHKLKNMLPACGTAAVEMLEHAGTAPLAGFAERLKKTSGLDVFLYDGDKQIIPGLAIVAEILKIVKAAEKSDRVEYTAYQEYAVAAYRVTGSSGKTYVFAARMPHSTSLSSFLPFFASPPRPPPGHSGPPPGRDHGFSPPGRPPEGHLAPPDFSWFRLAMHLLLSGIVCYGLARYLTSPIMTLRRATQRIAAGDLSVRVSRSMGKRRDVISGLVHDFDRMAERLEALITAQKNLLRDISHELRSPLARLNVALELCRKKLGGDAEMPLARIEKESEKLGELISQLLALNVLESGLSHPQDKEVDLGDLVQEIAVDAEFEGAGMNKTVHAKIDRDVMVRGNRELMRRAVENVVRNALRYTSEEGPVEIRLKAVRQDKAPYALIVVRDHGPGVPDESLADLFKPFYRVDEDRDRKTGGAGIGLAITEAAVRYHQGQVVARNAHDGGLTVEIRLPITG